MRYFLNTVPIQPDISPLPTKPFPGTGELPYGPLGGDRFEALTYRLKKRQHGDTATVCLMPGVGERGRDIVVYDLNGRVIEIVQCKNLGTRLQKADLQKELMKLALHALLEPDVIGTGPIRYEVWAPGGLAEKASKVINNWPNAWADEAVAASVINQFKRLSAFTWSAVEEHVLKTFPTMLRPHALVSPDIDAQVRGDASVMRDYFEVNMVADLDDVVTVVNSAMGALELLSDSDLTMVAKRMKSFPQFERFKTTFGLVFGLPKPLIARMTQSEFTALYEAVIAPVFQLQPVLVKALVRLSLEASGEFRRKTPGVHPALPSLLGRVMGVVIVLRFRELVGKPFDLNPEQRAFMDLTLRDKLLAGVHEEWPMFQRCIEGYDPSKHAPGSDEELRHRIGRSATRAFASQADFDAQLRKEITERAVGLNEAYNGVVRLIPKDFFMVADAKSVFNDVDRLKAMFAEVEEMAAIRGSDILPEP